MKVWSHAVVVPAKPGDVVSAGADVISHIHYLVYEANDQLPATVRSIRGFANYSLPVDAPVMSRLLQSMKARGTMLDGTLFQVEYAGVRAEADPDRPDLHAMRSWSYAVARRAHVLGIPLVAGTDLMGRPGIDSVSYLHTDIELLVKQAGMTPVQAISAATLNGARAVGREKEQGTIEPGKVADLVVLAADPTADIRNTRGIMYVIKEGQPHQRALADHIRALAASRRTPPQPQPAQDSLVWRPSWPGTSMALVRGDMSTPGREFTFRFRMPDNYWIPPHTHPTRATIRVISGELLVGMGQQEASARAYREGGTVVIETGMHHFEASRGPTVIEVTGVGPWGITFLDPTAVPGVRRR